MVNKSSVRLSVICVYSTVFILFFFFFDRSRKIFQIVAGVSKWINIFPFRCNSARQLHDEIQLNCVGVTRCPLKPKNFIYYCSVRVLVTVSVSETPCDVYSCNMARFSSVCRGIGQHPSFLATPSTSSLHFKDNATLLPTLKKSCFTGPSLCRPHPRRLGRRTVCK